MTERIYTNISAISKFMSNDIPIGIKDYAVRKINELLNLIYDAMDADTELVTFGLWGNKKVFKKTIWFRNNSCFYKLFL